MCSIKASSLAKWILLSTLSSTTTLALALDPCEYVYPSNINIPAATGQISVPRIKRVHPTSAPARSNQLDSGRRINAPRRPHPNASVTAPANRHQAISHGRSTSKVASRVRCSYPVSTPPGGITIVPGIPFIGTPPVWGEPYPPRTFYGPAPIYPGSPGDIWNVPNGPSPEWGNPHLPERSDSEGYPRRGTPVGRTPPTDVPEPPTISLILFGIALIIARRYL